MPNSIDAHIEFSFKGETHSLFARIDLDDFLGPGALPPSIHAVLAREHGIDTYSYLYEVMQEEDIRFDNAQGLASNYLKDGMFDMEGCFTGLQENMTLDLLQAISKRELGIADLEQHPALKKALLQAYSLGKNA
ncbi:MAG: hypothetical protein K8H84_12950 [Sulfuricella denitrificans]|nr:hypothetical protein [Sulfuricella denitrificans]